MSQNENQCRALIAYRQKYFTIEERLALMQCENYRMVRDSIWNAAIRSMGVPLGIIYGETSYSSFASGGK